MIFLALWLISLLLLALLIGFYWGRNRSGEPDLREALEALKRIAELRECNVCVQFADRAEHLNEPHRVVKR